MLARCTVVVAFASSMVALMGSALSQEPSRDQCLVTIKIYEKPRDAAKPKVLAEPTIAVVPGRVFSFESGGGCKTSSRHEDLAVGTRVHGKLERPQGGGLPIAMKISVGELVDQIDDPQTEMVMTETIDLRTIVQPGETKRIKCSTARWCEVRVDAVE